MSELFNQFSEDQAHAIENYVSEAINEAFNSKIQDKVGINIDSPAKPDFIVSYEDIIDPRNTLADDLTFKSKLDAIQRYSVDSDGYDGICYEEDPEGDFIKFEDLYDLISGAEDELTREKNEIKRLRDALKDIGDQGRLRTPGRPQYYARKYLDESPEEFKL